MKSDYKDESRRSTPWDEAENRTPSQGFIKKHHIRHYQEKHKPLSESEEAEMINSKVPDCCPYCRSNDFKKAGFSSNGIQMYRCSGCGRKFTVLSGTIFDSHKLSIGEWIEYLFNLFSYMSLNADSWNNKNAFTTSRYWLQKVFMLVEEYQKSIILEGDVILDETFYSVRTDEIEKKPDGMKYRGLSRNQICIGVACDRNHVFCVLEGYGKPSKSKSFEAFRDHIKPGSILIHDKEGAHSKLVDELLLESKAYSSAFLKRLPDKDNPLAKVNRLHFFLKRFFYAHTSFKREEIGNFINLFSFVMNPPSNKLEKVDILINLGLTCTRKLRFRDFYHVN